MTEKNEITFEDLHELPEAGEFVSEQSIDTPEEAKIRNDFGAIANKSSVAKFEEKCGACRGTGNFVSYAGRLVGPCFKCKGSGIRKFKTSPETRAKAKTRAATKKVAVADEKKATAEQYKDDNKALVEYLNEVSDWNSFASSLLQAISNYGSLTEKQLAAALKMQAKHVAKNADAIVQAQDGIDLTDLASGMYAVPDGDTRLKVSIYRPKKGNWVGWTFVNDGAAYGNRQDYGKQGPDRMYVGKIVKQLEAIMADPKAAMQAYGHLTGHCGACGKVLENELSLERGIGPICWAKF
jgi:hypothetical protein